jgi:hypothetical protein
MDLSGKNGIKTANDLQKLLDINGRHLGFTFLIGQMTEVMAPDI